MSLEISAKYPWLQEVLQSNPSANLASSVLIEGESGLAKSHLASFYAKNILCLESLGESCDCRSCIYFEAGTHPDYCFLNQDDCSSALHQFSKKGNDSKPTVNSKTVKGARALSDFMCLTNSVSASRVAVIFDAEAMNLNAQNALLKTLEELPENKYVLLVSDKRKNFLPTIYSRSRIISINNPSSESINDWLSTQGYVEHRVTNFAPDLSPLAIVQIIESGNSDQYKNLTALFNQLCEGRLDVIDASKTLKALEMSYPQKIYSLISFTKSLLGTSVGYFKSHPLISISGEGAVNEILASELVAELLDYQASLVTTPSLNEQIGLSYFLYKLKDLILLPAK